MSATIPEVADDRLAPEAVRTLYADIRSTLATPVVNLVFRRLAALGPDTLEQAWSHLRPAYCDGRIAACGGEVLRVARTCVSPLPPSPTTPHLAPDALAAVPALISTYNYNNARNLVAFIALLGEYREGRDAGAAPPSSSSQPPTSQDSAPKATPPLPSLGKLQPDLQRAIARLNRFGENDAEDGPIASLYLHLAHWPVVLGFAEELLRPLDAEGLLTRWRDEVLVRASQTARLLKDLRATPELRARIAPILWPLVNVTIPKMIPIGSLLLALLRKDA